MTTTSNATNEEPTHPSALPLRRFIALDQVQEIFSISRSQAYALARSGELRAIQVGRQDSEIPKSLAITASFWPGFAVSRDADDVVPELLGIGSRHDAHPSLQRSSSATDHVTPTRAPVPTPLHDT